MENPTVRFNSRGQSGNIYFILGMVRDALRKQSRITEFNDLRDAVFSSGSYEEALAEIRKHVTLIDEDGRY